MSTLSGALRGPLRGPRTLRWRLVAILSGLLAAVSIVIGGVTVIALNSYLVGQLDHSLTAAFGRASSAKVHADINGTGPNGPPPAGAFVGSPGQSADTVVAAIVSGQFVAEGYIDSSGNQESLSASAQSTLLQLPTDGKPYTRDLGGTLGSYRLVSTQTPDGTVLVTGLPLAGVQGIVNQLTLVVVLVALSGLIAAIFAGALSIRVALRPLQRIASTASSVTELPLDKGEVALSMRVPQRDIAKGSEVGQVGTALNSLLEHVATALAARQAAEDKIRRFVADASHELRTPLSSVRAYAELTRRDYADAPEGITHNVGRIESEAVRMSSLVEDLLLLAHLDADEELRRSEVDLSQIVLEAVEDAHVAGPDHRWLIDIPADPVVISGDEMRIRRVVVNLLANARIHTPAGTKVRATLRPAPDGALIQISDDGPGIEPGLAGSLFERFSRGDSSRSREAGTTGLGLSIVRAIVDAHGGEVSVESVPGDTRFRVFLPR